MFHYFKLFCKVCLDVSGKVCMNIKTQVLNFIVENMTVILHFVEEFKTSIGKNAVWRNNILLLKNKGYIWRSWIKVCIWGRTDWNSAEVPQCATGYNPCFSTSWNVLRIFCQCSVWFDKNDIHTCIVLLSDWRLLKVHSLCGLVLFEVLVPRDLVWAIYPRQPRCLSPSRWRVTAEERGGKRLSLPNFSDC